MTGQYMKNKGFGWQQLWPYRGKILASSWTDCGTPQKPVRVGSKLADI
jgi:hypothetical protein